MHGLSRMLFIIVTIWFISISEKCIPRWQRRLPSRKCRTWSYWTVSLLIVYTERRTWITEDEPNRDDYSVTAPAPAGDSTAIWSDAQKLDHTSSLVLQVYTTKRWHFNCFIILNFRKNCIPSISCKQLWPIAGFMEHIVTFVTVKVCSNGTVMCTISSSLLSIYNSEEDYQLTVSVNLVLHCAIFCCFRVLGSSTFSCS